MNPQTRYTQVHLQEVNNQAMDLPSMKAAIFRSLIREYTHFVQNVELGCATDLCSDPSKSKPDLSLFCGSGSYAFLYLRMHKFFSNLTQEEIGFYQEKALNHLPDEKMNEFFNPNTYLDLAEKQLIALCSVAGMLKDQNISFCFSNYALYIFQAQIAYAKKDINKFKAAIQQVLHYKDLILKKPNNFENELLYGIPGYVYMLLLLQKQYGADHIEPEFKISLKQEIYQLCTIIVDQALVINYELKPANLLQKILNNQIDAETLKLAITFGKRNYFGGAHGVLGVIQILIQSYELCQDYFTQPNNAKFTEIMFLSIIDTLDYLIDIFQTKQNIPSSYQNLDNLKLFQFCHGIIGAISPLLKTAKFKNKPNYIDVCKKMVEEIWKYGVLKKGYGLCHGIPGNAYPFMQLHQVTNEPQLLEKAYVFLQYKMNQKIMEAILNFDFNDRLNKGISDHPFSLMLGSVGDMSAMMDFLKYEGMPAYEV